MAPTIERIDSGCASNPMRVLIRLTAPLVPFFGDIFVTSIDYEMLQKFARWREAKMDA